MAELLDRSELLTVDFSFNRITAIEPCFMDDLDRIENRFGLSASEIGIDLNLGFWWREIWLKKCFQKFQFA